MNYKTMKAAVCTKYGNPKNTKIIEVPIPDLKQNELMIKIYASTISSGDCVVRSASNPFVRLYFGIHAPRKKILGTDLAGVVVATGSNANLFHIGDRVIASTGMVFGTHAEYIVMNEEKAISKFNNQLTFKDATAIAFGGSAALHYLRKIQISKNSKILIYGASGAVGTATVQLAANYYKAHTTGLCSNRNKKLIHDLGAHVVFDYNDPNTFHNLDQYDYIFDAVGKTKKSFWKPYLKKGGKFLTIAQGLVKEEKKDLELLLELTQNQTLKPVIDRVYPFNKIQEAYTYVDTGRKRGNVVLEIKKEE